MEPLPRLPSRLTRRPDWLERTPPPPPLRPASSMTVSPSPSSSYTWPLHRMGCRPGQRYGFLRSVAAQSTSQTSRHWRTPPVLPCPHCVIATGPHTTPRLVLSRARALTSVGEASYRIT